MKLKVKINNKEVAGAIKKVIVRADQYMRKTIAINSALTATHIKLTSFGGYKTTDTRLVVRSGQLRNSIIPRPIKQVGTRIKGGVQFGKIYSKIHVGRKEKETTIKAKGDGWLVIPQKAALTQAGVARGKPRSGIWGKTFFKKDKAGKRTYLWRKKEGGGIEPLFMLIKEVKVKTRIHPEDIFKWVKPKIKADLKRVKYKTL